MVTYGHRGRGDVEVERVGWHPPSRARGMHYTGEGGRNPVSSEGAVLLILLVMLAGFEGAIWYGGRAVGAGCSEAVALALLLLGAGTVRLGAKGFSPGGLPAGFGLRVRGAPGKALGLLLIALGLAMTAPFLWLLFWPR
jgi:hypothetical protein